MSGVWRFKDGVLRLDSRAGEAGGGGRRKVLVHVPTNEVITSNEMLERKLASLGWERYPPGDPALLQFHQRSTVHLITVPTDFSRISTVHMYDVVVKTRNIFEVRDA